MEIWFLGTGSAEGIPSIGCMCPHCQRARQEGGKLRRERSAIFVKLPGYNLLIDTPPRVRRLLDLHGITQIDGIFLTHEHFDHANGLSEFRYWPKRLDLLAVPTVYERLRRQEWGEQLPEIAFHLPCRPGVALHFQGFFLVPFQVVHPVPTYGLAIFEGRSKVVFTSDTGPYLSRYARCLIADADALIVNAPFFHAPKRSDHIDVQQALALREQVHVHRLILTHINHHNKPHDELEDFVQRDSEAEVAYDGWRLEI
jgi:phosphoribosyl 1,2-cyclic phosphate phosphodiesterase